MAASPRAMKKLPMYRLRTSMTAATNVKKRIFVRCLILALKTNAKVHRGAVFSASSGARLSASDHYRSLCSDKTDRVIVLSDNPIVYQFAFHFY